jgi:hypothetical protein
MARQERFGMISPTWSLARQDARRPWRQEGGQAQAAIIADSV